MHFRGGPRLWGWEARTQQPWQQRGRGGRCRQEAPQTGQCREARLGGGARSTLRAGWGRGSSPSSCGPSSGRRGCISCRCRRCTASRRCTGRSRDGSERRGHRGRNRSGSCGSSFDAVAGTRGCLIPGSCLGHWQSGPTAQGSHLGRGRLPACTRACYCCSGRCCGGCMPVQQHSGWSRSAVATAVDRCSVSCVSTRNGIITIFSSGVRRPRRVRLRRLTSCCCVA